MTTDLSKIMRVRCPNDGKGAGDHLAVDVRLPNVLEHTGKLLVSLSRCPFGASMQIRYDDTPALGSVP